MKVLVLNNAVPFVRGGAEEFADCLVDRLNRLRGVEAALLRIPFRWEPAARIVDEILINQNLRLYHVDRVIGLKFPAYLIPHPNKILWLLHQFRQAYDLYDSGLSNLCGEEYGKRIAGFVHKADEQCFAECKAIFTNSPVTRARLKKYNNVEGTVLYPPLIAPECFRGGDYGNYIFAGGRVNPGKRQHILIEAMRGVQSKLKLVIAGPSDDDQYLASLERLVATNDLGDRVELRVGFRPRQEIADLANGALACAYLPIDEDSLGYVTMEAFCAAKPVVTTSDAGGLLEIVRDGETGFVVAPDPAAVAQAFDRFFADPTRTKEMGQAGRAVLETATLTWDETIARLLN